MKTPFCLCCQAGWGAMEIAATLTESEVLPRVRANYPRPALGWCLLLTVSSAQVLAASCLSYYILKGQLQNKYAHPQKSPVSPQPQWSEKCTTRWTLARNIPQVDHANETELTWQTIEGQVFTGNCTEYKENSMEIKKTGVYYIFFQVMFKSDHNNVKFVMDSHGEKTTQYSEKRMSSKTVYFGSIYKLRNGMKISVISNPEKIQTGDSETFIGLIEL